MSGYCCDKYHVVLIFLLLFTFACRKTEPPPPNVYRALDGVWSGSFNVYRLKQQTEQRPRNLKDVQIPRPGWQPTQIIQVRQEYKSESPVFQTVRIQDSYIDDSGKKQVVESHGVNKIQDGKMLCIVHKPDETVTHTGRFEKPNTIIWSRDLRRPGLKIEYFRETVLKNTYTIKGYGYYNQDDPNKGPRYWFYGEYKRVR